MGMNAPGAEQNFQFVLNVMHGCRDCYSARPCIVCITARRISCATSHATLCQGFGDAGGVRRGPLAQLNARSSSLSNGRIDSRNPPRCT
jgi:hypothetical protein